MDPDLEKTIRKALADAKAKGKDHVAQAQEAVRIAQQARPDMKRWDVVAAVNLLRHR